MVKVKNGNKILRVDERNVDSYLKRGFDQIDDKGKVVKRATGGRSVSLATYNQVLDELEKLKKLDVSKEATKADIIAELEKKGFKFKG